MNTYRKLSEEQYIQEAANIFNQIFRSSDPFDEPFKNIFEKRSLIYPVFYELDKVQLQALVKAAQAVGDTGMYVSFTERPPAAEQDRAYHWYFPFDEIVIYDVLQEPLENAIYSTNAKWGLLISHEKHCVIAGSKFFIKILFDNLPFSEDEYIFEFLELWKWFREDFISDIEWLPILLKHLFGKEKATEYLHKTGIEI